MRDDDSFGLFEFLLVWGLLAIAAWVVLGVCWLAEHVQVVIR